ncbi:alpha,alpha-trehalase TreA [Sphingomonas koreensis]|jgi:alpha,alpha-trehalase|uniref:Trehalase n=2 Tax=Sphingomonas koreensis TaxID=93064 RepID=A0A1L6JAU1_9SPHN|nr:alpha,alpha-trehalase TreA [Sphingomonas koreensis]APR53042.1 trehalase [Sphingomonas koreensis]MDC7810291.1 alpha,alpha-trehalase TreA [Sphingomonas koreensis]RSU17798.1 alpha,alpha-trehalase TreA [Sphingomonas koreensis]RSU20872.1 alpha,alpha-trehalase TreA [Sphingomonas koreensis]RSU23560.1 alpha,alpha-trehalase TreA [Sphingomonas koreensis]
MSVPQPSDLFGDLFTTVQECALFPDSKTFADAVPRRGPEAIMQDWKAQPPSGDAGLRAFVDANFVLPTEADCDAPDGRPLREHITQLWPVLTREPETPAPGSSLLALPRRHVVPGGRFRELYYWDSYFTMLGLVRSDRQDLVEDMIAVFGSLLDGYGHIPNGTRSYYLSRSHPPVFYLMAALSQDRSANARAQRLRWMRAEHEFWMAGEKDLAPGGEHRRVVRLADGALLNRYWDDRAAPRDESWREDIELAQCAPDRDAPELWRDIRAAAESGWDFSSRWLGDGQSLETIRTTRLLPIDLNALLFGLEQAIAEEAKALGDDTAATEFARRADARREAIDLHLWHPDAALYADYDLDLGRASGRLTAALGFALFTGVASAQRAPDAANAIAGLLRAGGLLTTECVTGQQWDAPNGWAPLHWVAIEGLRAYGQNALADTIAQRWLAMVASHYDATGQLLEKYDIEQCRAGGGGEYGTEIGFGWTNGVTLALMQDLG